MWKFYSLEGGEGAGKSAVIAILKEKLEALGHDVMITREPGGVELAEKIRHLLVSGSEDMDLKTEILLFAAARRVHWSQKVLPALLSGKIVICDRFIDSSTVYQGFVRGGDQDMIKVINDYATDSVFPNKTFFLDVNPEEGLNRIARNNRETNRFDEKDMQFHLMVQEGYRELCKQDPTRIQWINANKELEQVVEEVWETVQKLT